MIIFFKKICFNKNMDKKLSKVMKKQEKQDFLQKMKKIISSKKRFWLVNVFGFLICSIAEFFVCWLVRTDFNLSFSPLDKSDFEKPDNKRSVAKAFFVIFLLIILLIVTLKFS